MLLISNTTKYYYAIVLILVSLLSAKLSLIQFCAITIYACHYHCSFLFHWNWGCNRAFSFFIHPFASACFSLTHTNISLHACNRARKVIETNWIFIAKQSDFICAINCFNWTGKLRGSAFFSMCFSWQHSIIDQTFRRWVNHSQLGRIVT